MDNKRVDWFYNAKWGVFIDYLADGCYKFDESKVPAEEWNKRVDAYDVNGLAQQLHEIQAPYIVITIGQNSGHYCSPNATYDRIVGHCPSKCSRRDLVADLHGALAPYGIKLIVYVTSGAPCRDKIAMEKFEYKWGYKGVDWPQFGKELTGLRLAEFQLKWEAVIREWSLRWGKKVSGWWVDGCYFNDDMYKHADAPNFKSFAAALRAGNPESILSFGDGSDKPPHRVCEEEDYTNRETSEVFSFRVGRWVDGAQYHIGSYLGDGWGKGKPRFINEFVLGYTKDVNAKGGVVSWDVPTEYNGLIPEPFVRQLKALKGGWMGSGRKYRAEREQRENAPLPGSRAPKLAEAVNADLGKVDWTKAGRLEGWRQITGLDTKRNITGWIVHDGAYLYIKLEDHMDPAKLIGNDMWDGDNWEIFIARARGKLPYYQFAVNRAGKQTALVYETAVAKDGKAWESGMKVLSDTKSSDRWTVFLAIPMAKLAPEGIKAGQKIYANFCRTTSTDSFGTERLLAWSPNLEANFHKLDRLGELVFE